MSPKEFCTGTKLSLWIVNVYLKSYIFCFHFTLYLHVWIRIQKASEYGSNTDLDPHHCWKVVLFSCKNVKVTTKQPDFRLSREKYRLQKSEEVKNFVQHCRVASGMQRNVAVLMHPYSWRREFFKEDFGSSVFVALFGSSRNSPTRF